MEKNTLITDADIAGICELVHLDVTPEEISEIQGQLNCTLNYVQKLKLLNLDNVEPAVYGQPAKKNIYRDDVAISGIGNEIVMDNAPERIGPEFKVPKIVE